jgi:dTDP-4-amino-4,6-dideoxygalactose transaminase
LRKVPFYLHDLDQEELAGIAKVFEGTILTTGEFVSEFEQRFADYMGCKNAVACTSWTGAAHLSLLSLGIGPGDEVITTPMTFIATATAIIQSGAKPVFVDVEPDTGNISSDLIEAAITTATKAIMPVHLYGQMCDMKKLRRIADQHGLYIVEDSAHCLEGTRDHIKPGQLSDVACFSFFATKNISCGEGGAAITNRDDLSEKIRLLRLHGMTKTSAEREREGYQHWDMICMGWKYNMDNIHAAILLPQLDRIEVQWKKRQNLADWYFEELKQVEGVTWPRRLNSGRHANHLFPIWVDPAKRDSIIERLWVKGVGSVVNYRAIHLLTFFREKYRFNRGLFPVAEKIGDSTITLPFYCKMNRDDVKYVVESLAGALNSQF